MFLLFSMPTFSQANFDSPPIEIFPNVPITSILVDDLDGDDFLDIAVVSYVDQSVSILRNSGLEDDPYSFEEPVIFGTPFDRPSSITSGDIDGDGKPELLVPDSNFDGVVTVYHNESSTGNIDLASFQNYHSFNTNSGSIEVNLGDFNHDGKWDLLVSNANDYPVILENTSTEGIIDANSFGPKINLSTSCANRNGLVGDFNYDGITDISITCLSDGLFTFTFLNESGTAELNSNTFELSDTLPCGFLRSIKTAYINHDNALDLAFIENDSLGFHCMINESIADNEFGSLEWAEIQGLDQEVQMSALETGRLGYSNLTDIITSNRDENMARVYQNITDEDNMVDFQLEHNFAIDGKIVDIDIAAFKDSQLPDFLLSDDENNRILLYPNTGTAIEMPSDTTGTAIHTKNEMIHFHPNPVEQFLEVDLQNEPIDITFYNLQGIPVKHITAKDKTTINLNDLSHGIYFASFQREGKWYTKKLIKQ